MSTRLSALYLLFGCCGFAAGPVATLTAGLGVTINGHTVQTTGAPNWPLSAGDKIVTATASAVVTFPDGTVLTLRPRTWLVLQLCDRCVAQLFQGSVEYRKAVDSSFEFCALGHPVTPIPGAQGSVTIEHLERVVVRAAGQEQLISAGECSCRAGAPWASGGNSKKTKVAIIVVAATAATGTTVAVTRPSDKSPTGKAKNLQ